jgi:tRNA(Ile)-lysidine synthase
MESKGGRDLEQNLLKTIEAFVVSHQLFQTHGKVLVACSGGSDSLALLHLMHLLSKKIPMTLGVVHLDHGQHDKSKEAVSLVKKHCRRLKLPFFSYTADVARLPPGSNEAVCRTKRYQIYCRACLEQGFSAVATGHTRDDQVETVLMRILRGTQTSGLLGIPPKRGKFVRPLLACGHSELVLYLKAKRIRWFEDPTNLKPHFIRNRIRRKLLPFLRAQFNPAVDHAILRLSKSALRDNDCLSKLLPDAAEWKPSKEKIAYPLSEILDLPDAVLSRLLIRMLHRLHAPSFGVPSLHLEKVFSLLHSHKSGEPWSIDFPNRVKVGVESGSFYLRRGKERFAKPFEILVSRPGKITLPGNRCMCFRAVKKWHPQKTNTNHVFFSAKEAAFPLLVRSMKPGDKMRLFGGVGRHKVSRILMDAKIPRSLRSHVPLLIKGEDVLWVGGVRRSDLAKVKKGTKSILSVTLL